MAMTKTKFAELTAAVTLCSGIGMAVAGFLCPPAGEISDSVLMYTAQTLIYAGSVLGVNVVIDQRIRDWKEKGRQ